MENNNKTIGIVGSGISGLSSAWALTKAGWKVTLFESLSTLGGHSLTVTTNEIIKNGPLVDLGFQVFNRTTYPYLEQMFKELNVNTEPSDMSFAVSINDGETEWASHGLDSVFAQRKNIISPKFLTMIREIFRFADNAEEVLDKNWDQNMTVGEYLNLNGFSDIFANEYLLPMTNAVWSVPTSKMLEFPIVPLIKFWSNHHLLNPLGDRPRWRVVSERTNAYVKAIEKFLLENNSIIKLNSKVLKLSENKNDNKIIIITNDNNEYAFDHVILATHAPITYDILKLSENIESLVDLNEIDLIKNIPYQPNDVILHQDRKQMPKNEKAWASWNVLDRTSLERTNNVCCTYWLNRLQNLPENTPELFCTLNPIEPIPENKIIKRFTLDHPVFNIQSIESQKQINIIQSIADKNKRKIWFAGAYLGSGFHEDGIRSAMAICKRLDAAPSFITVENPAIQLVRGPNPTYTIKQRLSISLFTRICKQAISKGFMRVILPSGDELGPFGRISEKIAKELNEPACTLWIQDLNALYKCVKDSDIGIGEAYMDGMIETNDGGIIDLLDLLAANMSETLKNLNRSIKFGDSLPTIAGLTLYKWGNSLNNIKHRFRKNTVQGSRKNIQAHYDIGNPLYELFLDKTMTYSSGIHTKECGADIFSKKVMNNDDDEPLPLYDAQLAKLDAIIARAGLKKTDTVLEIGCGWGSFAIRAAETIGCLVIGITISTEQYKIACDRVRERGLDHLIDLRICDYRKLGLSPETPPPNFFDKIVSIEMLEAVGHEHLPQYFETCNRMLKNGGTALIQVISIPNERYEDYCNGSDFIREHIFPGGHLPSLNALNWATEGTNLHLKQIDDIGPDYAITLRMWRENFMNHKTEIKAMNYPIRFIRMWEFYLAYCEVGFQRKVIHDWHLRYEKNELINPRPIPIKTIEQSYDWPTIYLLSIWILACSMAVYRIGTHLLVVPATMSLVVAFHIMSGSIMESSNGSMKRKQINDKIMLGINTILGIYGSYILQSSTTTNYILIVLLGLGVFGGELFSIVAGRYHKQVGWSRIIFLCWALSLVCLSVFFDKSMEYLSMFIVVDQIANVPTLVRKILNAYHFTLESLLYQLATFGSFASTFILRFGIHSFLGYSVTIAYFNGELESYWYLIGAGIALLYDIFSLTDLIWEIKVDIENRVNTLNLIQSRPDKFLQTKDQLVSNLTLSS